MKPLVIETGYYHPSNANWSYHIFMIIDNSGARLYKSTFGGERRIKGEVDYGFAGIGSNVKYPGRVVAKLHDIENYNGKNWGKGSLDKE